MKRSLMTGVITLLSCAVAATVLAATIQRLGREVNVSRSATPTEKAKALRLVYASAGRIKKGWLFTYADGPVGQQNVFARASFDEGVNWTPPILLSRDGAGNPTGGQKITTAMALSFTADNDKPSIFAPPTTSGPMVMVVWNSAYCPQDPGSHQAGAYVSTVQGTGDFDRDGTPDRPFHCEWVASTTDPELSNWDVQQLTNGQRDAIGEVVSGNATGTAFALAWQEDAAGLQPGEAEGRGDGGSGANVSGGTNIWYTRAPTVSGETLRSNTIQVSNNDATGTGQPGASRPNLQLSGSTAVLAYEESNCPGGSGGKCIVYHAFPFATPDVDSGGTVLSDVTHNARRVRFVLQGAAAAGSSPLRTVVLWRDSPVITPGAPADLVVRRGLVDAKTRPGSTGFLPADLLADIPQRMTNVALSGGNINAHRAIVRGNLIGVAYDLTPDMAGANADATPATTANYNLYFTRSLSSGAVGSWSTPVNLSGIESPATTVVEPRLAPTPGTINNPLTGEPDPGDTQNPNVFYVAYGTESNDASGLAGRIFVSRSSDQGATFEPFVPVSATTAGQSEAQLRPVPDGSSAMVLWMGEQVQGQADTKDVVYATAESLGRPDLVILVNPTTVVSGESGTLNLMVRNVGQGPADSVALEASLPAGLTLLGATGATQCNRDSQTVACKLARLPVGQSAIVSLSVSSAAQADYTVTANVRSGEADIQPIDNVTTARISAVASDSPTPAPTTTTADSQGGGCTVAGTSRAVDPLWSIFLAGAALGLARRHRPRPAPPPPPLLPPIPPPAPGPC